MKKTPKAGIGKPGNKEINEAGIGNTIGTTLKNVAGKARDAAISGVGKTFGIGTPRAQNRLSVRVLSDELMHRWLGYLTVQRQRGENIEGNADDLRQFIGRYFGQETLADAEPMISQMAGPPAAGAAAGAAGAGAGANVAPGTAQGTAQQSPPKLGATWKQPSTPQSQFGTPTNPGVHAATQTNPNPSFMPGSLPPGASMRGGTAPATPSVTATGSASQSPSKLSPTWAQPAPAKPLWGSSSASPTAAQGAATAARPGSTTAAGSVPRAAPKSIPSTSAPAAATPAAATPAVPPANMPQTGSPLTPGAPMVPQNQPQKKQTWVSKMRPSSTATPQAPAATDPHARAGQIISSLANSHRNSKPGTPERQKSEQFFKNMQNNPSAVARYPQLKTRSVRNTESIAYRGQLVEVALQRSQLDQIFKRIAGYEMMNGNAFTSGNQPGGGQGGGQGGYGGGSAAPAQASSQRQASSGGRPNMKQQVSSQQLDRIYPYVSKYRNDFNTIKGIVDANRGAMPMDQLFSTLQSKNVNGPGVSAIIHALGTAMGNH